jgi:hypothetical protein
LFLPRAREVGTDGVQKDAAGEDGDLDHPRRRDDKAERARHEFDVLAMPSTIGKGTESDPCYSFKMYDEFWYVLAEDIPSDE